MHRCLPDLEMKASLNSTMFGCFNDRSIFTCAPDDPTPRRGERSRIQLPRPRMHRDHARCWRTSVSASTWCLPLGSSGLYITRFITYSLPSRPLRTNVTVPKDPFPMCLMETNCVSGCGSLEEREETGRFIRLRLLT